MAAGAIGAVLLALTLCGLRAVGFEWFVVTTPSMGTAVPVGALVVDAPTEVGALAVGDVITFLPPGPGQTAHTHRVSAIGPAGVTTRGDANAVDDPWVLTASRISGRVVAVLPGLGWLLRALPLLLAGGLATWGAAAALKRSALRGPVVLLGASLSLAVASVVLRPLVQVVLVAASSGADGARATVVSTGLLPVRVSAASGVHADLVAGETATLRSVGAPGQVDLTVAAHLPLLGWAAVVLVCLLPSLVPFVLAARRGGG